MSLKDSISKAKANSVGFVISEVWTRTCQECGNKQTDKKPDKTKELTEAYKNRKCKKCKSEALDYGSVPSNDKWIDE